jgi:hypothetical protein
MSGPVSSSNRLKTSRQRQAGIDVQAILSNLSPTQSRCTNAVIIGILGIVLTACGGGGGGESAPPSTAPSTQSAISTRPVAQTDIEIAQALYLDNQRKPANFLVDAAPSGLGAVATLHLKNSDVGIAGASQYELCTDDFNQALAWSETAANSNGNHDVLVSNDATARYFEFSRTRNSTPTLYVRSRIYKCSYLDRANVNLQDTVSATRTAGQLAVNQVNSSELRTLSEYLWQFTTFNNAGHAVLMSSSSTGQNLSHTLYIASMTRAAVGQTCDEVEVTTWTHSVTSTGAVQLRVDEAWSYGIRRTGGLIEYCALN